MDTQTITLMTLATLGALIIGGVLGMVVGRHQRTKRLQEKFGPEYEHTMHELGDQRRAEHELESRLDHVKKLDIRPLSAEEINRFTSEWRTTQAEFVDEPRAAMQKADRLLGKVMQAKGYPVEDFEQQAADISVDYPELVMDYRGLHLIAVKGRDEKISTEEMRKAMVHGRALFDRLVQRTATVEEAEVVDGEEIHEKEKA